MLREKVASELELLIQVFTVRIILLPTSPLEATEWGQIYVFYLPSGKRSSGFHSPKPGGSRGSEGCSVAGLYRTLGTLLKL